MRVVTFLRCYFFVFFADEKRLFVLSVVALVSVSISVVVVAVVVSQ